MAEPGGGGRTARSRRLSAGLFGRVRVGFRRRPGGLFGRMLAYCGESAVFRRGRALLPRRGDLAEMRRHPRTDLMAGLTVAVVALPLALGFGVSSGLGAASGLATAVVAGALAALFGGSAVQVSGASGAMTVILMPIMSAHGATGVFTVGLLAGLLLLGLALAGAGRHVSMVPAPPSSRGSPSAWPA
ncbi:SulP family inorganic anion transporter [Nonomuraea salmonea]|uniref:SulP family inorganic anion transporter n=1 Tax=Nonomuraea salmonea TaxID=46181 RepID=UPI002FE7F259